MITTQALSVTSIKRIVSEVQELLTNPPEDIRVQLNEDDISDISAYIRGPGTRGGAVVRERGKGGGIQQKVCLSCP